ncbi:MAG: hypothetical protein M1142_02795 [Patescibacteria group bacterium]|nr:hypothetical protein [Patescibacteria group bacterium]
MPEGELRELPKLGIDFDGTMVNVIGPFVLWLRSTYPNKFTKAQYLNKNPDASDQKQRDYSEVRRVFMTDPKRIPDLSFYRGVLQALPLLKRDFSEIYINSLRWTDPDPEKDQESSIRGLLRENHSSEYISGILLRKTRDDRKWEVKLENTQEFGISYMVEDDSKIALRLAKYLEGIVLIRRPWNKHEPNNPGYDLANRENLIICRGLWDFAMGVYLAGSVEEFFVEHAEGLKDPVNLYTVYQAPVPAETWISLTVSRELVSSSS